MKSPNIKNVAIDGLSASIKAGEIVFRIGGCGSCHVDSGKSDFSQPPLLTGGKIFETKFGQFYSPNISPDKNFGIGSWTLKEFSNAVKHGISPNQEHYYPAFPYNSYKNFFHMIL